MEKRNQTGQVLIESLVIVLLLALSIVSVLSLYRKNIERELRNHQFERTIR